MSDLNTRHNRVVWFDMPVADLDRAIKFYAGVLAITVSREAFDGFEFAVLEHDQGNGGCLVPDAENVCAKGAMMYLNVDGRIRDAVARVPKLGGTVKQDVHPIGPHGFRALVLDSEGNRLALHSNSDA